MSESYKKLIKTLQTIFEMDKADLDFGIYRIMNQKRDDIDKFLEDDLLPQVKQAFDDYNSEGQGDFQQELGAAIEQAQKFGAPDPENSPAVLEIKAKMANAVDATALENDVFSKLHTFFSRYYDQGDFISQRRYKADTYAIPYQGEEVKLYWANYDQYYIKSSEHLRDYAFLAKEGANDDEKSVRIKLMEADTEKDNIKAKAGEERRFVLDEECPLSEKDGELLIHFNFIPVGKQKQEKLNEAGVETILAQEGFDEWLAILKAPSPTESKPKRTLLERHLNEYTARNTFDYFIHKDLGGFLNRELDFFIKNEVLFLDDIDDAAFSVTEQQLRKIKIIRSIAKKVIRMLTQLENFQKKLWLKKKFVVETNYCITLDRISFDAELYDTIFSNEDQLDEWESLFSIDRQKLNKDFHSLVHEELLNIKEYKYLLLDTKYFSQNFTNKLLTNIENITNSFEGLLVHSDNLQALNFIEGCFTNNIDGVYIDPPYNTDASAILYKNGFKDSSWLSLMKDRIAMGKKLMRNNALISVAIDDQEVHLLRNVLDVEFPKSIGVAVVKSNPQSRKTRGKFSPVHEYGLFYGKTEEANPSSIGYNQAKAARYPNEDEQGRYAWMNFIRAGSNDLRTDRPKLYYPIVVTEDDKIRIPELEWNQDAGSYDLCEEILATETLIYPIKEIDGNKIEKNWQRGHVRVSSEYNEHRVRRTPEGISIDFKTRMDADAAPVTWWDKGEYASANYGATELKDLFGTKNFDFPKAKGLVKDSLLACGANEKGGTYLDFFAGSGTSGQSIIELSRKSENNLRYVLCEQGSYMTTLIKPRLKKVVYHDSWKNGRPEFKENLNSISHGFKYILLESYEDTLNNLDLVASQGNKDFLNENQSLNEDYMLGYWLDTETADSSSLLNIEQFEDPFNYKLNIGSGSVGATKPTTIDLVETFNYLIGLTVKTIDVLKGFKLVTGTNPQGETVLVVWRNIKENDNDALESFLDKQGYNPRDTEFDHIYVNGDHTLEDPQSKVKMTEIEFKRLMFDVSDV